MQQQQYDTIEELMLELALYPNRKKQIVSSVGFKLWSNDYFVVAKDGNCALFNKKGDLDDINKVTMITDSMVPRDQICINIPESVTNIGSAAFCHSRLTSIQLPVNVEHIGYQAFIYSQDLKDVKMHDNVKMIDEYAFKDCISLSSITLSKKLAIIGDWAFKNCISLRDVVLPESLQYIGHRAFYQCELLQSIVIPDNVSGHNNPEGKDYIPPMFTSCTSLEDVTIGRGIDDLNRDEFNGCNNLKRVTFLGKTINQVKSLHCYPWAIRHIDDVEIICKR